MDPFLKGISCTFQDTFFFSKENTLRILSKLEANTYDPRIKQCCNPRLQVGPVLPGSLQNLSISRLGQLLTQNRFVGLQMKLHTSFLSLPEALAWTKMEWHPLTKRPPRLCPPSLVPFPGGTDTKVHLLGLTSLQSLCKGSCVMAFKDKRWPRVGSWVRNLVKYLWKGFGRICFLVYIMQYQLSLRPQACVSVKMETQPARKDPGTVPHDPVLSI